MSTSAATPFRLVFPLLLMATLMFASHWQVPPAVPDFEWLEIDKLAHFALYGLLATLWLRALAAVPFPPRRVLLAWGLTVGFGGLDELIQSFNVYRVFSPADWVADLAGATVGLALYCGSLHYRQLLEFRLRPRPSTPD